jgi:NADH-quinone oxidoreductase subunit F
MDTNILQSLQVLNQERILPNQPMIMAVWGHVKWKGADVVFATLQKQIQANGFDCLLKPVGCFGFCAQEPLLTVYQPGKSLLVYGGVDEKDALRILEGIENGKAYHKKTLFRIDSWNHLTSVFQLW